MIERETAARLVQEELERRHGRAPAGPNKVRMVVTHVEEHELVWMVHYQSEEFVRTRNPEAQLVGGGPYLVDRLDGGLHRIGVVSAGLGAWEDDYRSRIRGLPVRTAVDALHDEIRRIGADRGRMACVRELRRRLPVLSPAEAIQYATALLNGDAPVCLVAVATKELVKPLNPVLAVKTVLP